ncbi:mitochondrial carrier domain-containing protein [Zopfochytrium polystomum]|nr:mitochondrial carrier domain-containing protein [Zopfochytrium polystomum]
MAVVAAAAAAPSALAALGASSSTSSSSSSSSPSSTVFASTLMSSLDRHAINAAAAGKEAIMTATTMTATMASMASRTGSPPSPSRDLAAPTSFSSPASSTHSASSSSSSSSSSAFPSSPSRPSNPSHPQFALTPYSSQVHNRSSHRHSQNHHYHHSYTHQPQQHLIVLPASLTTQSSTPTSAAAAAASRGVSFFDPSRLIHISTPSPLVTVPTASSPSSTSSPPPPPSSRPSSVAIGGLAGAATAGFLELFLFHPVDTAAKRLIHHRGRNFPRGSSYREAAMGLRKIIFKDAANKGNLRALASLYPAFGYAVLYKMLQRSLQFGVHPIVNAHIRTNYGPSFTRTVGDTWAKTLMAGSAGVAIGIAEVVLLPLDALKVKGQTGTKMLSHASSPPAPSAPPTPPPPPPHVPAAAATATTTSHLASAGARHLHAAAAPPPVPRPTPTPTTTVAHLLRNPLLLANLYRGASWTAARNAFGCFALFGASTLVKDQVFHHYAPPTSASASPPPPPPVFELFVASLAGATASIAVAAPLDVVKVRVQASPLDAPGIVPKLLASAPKVTFSFTVAQALAAYFEERLGGGGGGGGGGGTRGGRH